MKLALSTKQFDQLEALLSKKVETLEFELVDREICEKAENGWMQLIPYSSISCYDPNNGDMKFLAYQRAEGTGEQRLVNATSIGFGGHVDCVGDVTCTKMETREDGTVAYHMTMADLLATSLAACKREWTEEIGFDPIEEFSIDIHNAVRFTFFRTPVDESTEENDVGRVHFGVSIPLTVSEEQMKTIYEKAKAQETEIKDLKEFVINAGQILMSFDVSEVASGVINRMTEEHKIEPWSVQVISQRLLEYFEMMRTHISYADIILAIKNNIEFMKVEAQAQQEAWEKNQAAEAQKTQDEANGIQDAEVKEVGQPVSTDTQVS